MIDSFRDQYFFLSNFFPCNIKYENVIYPTSEHAYQAAKTTSIMKRRLIAACNTPGKAKYMGRKQKPIRENWDQIKINVMKEILKIKFQNPELAIKLLQTENQTLIEGNDWKDYFWGVCNGKGNNHLGELLMEIRTNLQQLITV